MAIIKGNKVRNATSYELYKVTEGYTFTVQDNMYGGSDTVLYINGELQNTSIGTWENVKTVSIYCKYNDIIYFTVKQGTFPNDSYETQSDYTLTDDVVIENIWK